MAFSLGGCATTTDGSLIDNGVGGDNTIVGGGGGASGDNPGGGGIIIPGGGGSDTDASVDARPVRPQKCDDAGKCSCMNIASYGKFGTYGFNQQDNTTDFVTWLNSKSGVPVDTIGATTGAQHVPLTPALLGGYDVLIVQDLEDSEKGNGPFWTFQPAELQALADWVNAGGGLITLQGYSANTSEIQNVNQLLQFTGISYNGDDIFTEADRASFSNSYCWGDSVPMTKWLSSDPISTGLTAHITQVGAFHGRSINAGDAKVFVNTNDGTKVAGAAKNIGAGAVVVFNDEWLTYHSQWSVNPTDPNAQKCTNTYDPCFGKCADKQFQVAQFWYNVISWASAATQCPFVITEPDVIIK
jgi:hypothetical protein